MRPCRYRKTKAFRLFTGLLDCQVVNHAPPRFHQCQLGGAADPRLCAGGQDRERRVCDSGHACPVDGGWGPWGPWRCAQRCGRSPGKRTRRCDNPTPRWGGRPCRGPQWEAGLCRLAPCVDDLAGDATMPRSERSHDYKKCNSARLGAQRRLLCINHNVQYMLQQQRKPVDGLSPSELAVRSALRRSKGSNATLHCADAGRLRSRFPEATLRWEHEGRPLLLDQRRQLFTGGRLGE
ncbi:hypothetical protein HPB51_022441 [Rhipicephalus microplus]|uniref:Ig-like domain-containing protein n=1 Tax=Rhipicephalus microplus TaxID=6941 RepID=A0A9J6DR34_RHIMP|nr:hypothetical protein HPB51_022441 [Rhipicephalus microplus]